MDQPQAGQREQRVDLVDLLAERHDRAREAAGRDRRGLVAELVAQPLEHAVDLGGEAVDHARADRLDGRLADQRARRGEVDLGDRGGAAGERLHRDLDAGGDDAADVLARRPDDVVGDRGAEVDDHARPADTLERGDRVDEPVGADLARVVHADRHAGLQAGADDRHLVAEVALGHRGPLRPQLRHGRGEDRGVEVAEREVAQLQQAAQPRAELVGGRLAHGREAPVVHELVAAEGAEVGLRVADVDDEEHGRDYARRAMTAVLYAIPASHPVRGRRARAAAQGGAVPARRADPGRPPAAADARFGARSVPGRRVRRTARAWSARARSCARSSSASRSRRCSRRRRARAASSAPRSGATRCCSRSRGA